MKRISRTAWAVIGASMTAVACSPSPGAKAPEVTVNDAGVVEPTPPAPMYGAPPPPDPTADAGPGAQKPMLPDAGGPMVHPMYGMPSPN